MPTNRLSRPLLLALPILGPGAAVSGAPQPPVPLSPFLPHPALTVPQLVRQVRSDPKVRARYARYFRQPEDRVAASLAGLTAGTVPDTARYTVFCARGNGLIYPTRETLPRGTRVFAGRDGRPVLLARYGNPLTPFAPAVETHVIVQKYAVPGPARSTHVIQTVVPNTPQETTVPTGARPR